MERNQSNRRGGNGSYRQHEDDNYGSTYGGGRNLGGTSSYGSEGHYGSRQGRYNQGSSYGQGEGYGSMGGGSTYGGGSGQGSYGGSQYGGSNRRYEDVNDYGRDYDWGGDRGNYRNEYEDENRGEDRNFFERIGHGIRNAWDRITGHEEDDDRDNNYHGGESRGYDYGRRMESDGRFGSGVSGNHGGASYGGARRRTHQNNWGGAYGSQMNEMNEDWQGGGRNAAGGNYPENYGSRGVSNYGSDAHWGGRYGSNSEYRQGRDDEQSWNRPYENQTRNSGQQGANIRRSPGNINRQWQGGTPNRRFESYGGNYGNYGTGRNENRYGGNTSGFGSTYGGNYSGRQGGQEGQFANRVNQPNTQQGTSQNQWRGGRPESGNRNRLLGFDDYDRY